MPNQRKKDKALLGGYLPKEVVLAFQEAAKREGLTAKDALERVVREFLEKANGGTNEQAGK